MGSGVDVITSIHHDVKHKLPTARIITNAKANVVIAGTETLISYGASIWTDTLIGGEEGSIGGPWGIAAGCATGTVVGISTNVKIHGKSVTDRLQDVMYEGSLSPEQINPFHFQYHLGIDGHIIPDNGPDK